MKYCKKCGQNIETNDDICPKCREKFENSVQENNGVYNIRNPFLEFQNNALLNGNQESITTISQGLGIANNTNNVTSTPNSNSFVSSNIVEAGNQVQQEQNNNVGNSSINSMMSDITHKTQPPLVSEEKKKEEMTMPNDGFLVFPNDNKKEEISEQEAKENLERLKKLKNPVLDFDPQKIKEEKEKSEQEAKVKKEEENKSPKYMANIYITLAAIMLFLTIIPLIYNLQVPALVHHIVVIVLLVISYKLSTMNKKISSLMGIVSSIIMILTILEKDYATLALGVILLLVEGFSHFTKGKKLKSKI